MTLHIVYASWYLVTLIFKCRQIFPQVLIFVGPYTKYRSDLVVNLQYVCMSALYNPPHWPYTIPLTDPVCCPWKFQELWLVDTVHAGYPSRALIGQHKLGNTKPVLWQCGLLHVYTNWYRGWIYCTTVKRFQAQCVHPEYPVAVRILQGAQSSTCVHKLVKRLNLYVQL